MRDRVSNEHSMFERILLALFMANCMQVLVVFRCSIDSTVHRRLQTLSELTFLSCEFFTTVNYISSTFSYLFKENVR